MVYKTIILFYIFYSWTCVFALNFFPKYAQVITNNKPDSYFGYSILLQSAIQGNPARVIVGAPKANSSFLSLHREIVEPGAVYSCSLNGEQCQQFLFDSNANTIHRGPNGMSYVHKKDGGWLGSALDGDDFSTGLLVACAPRWRNQIHKDIYYLQNGLCYMLKDTTNLDRKAEEMIPLLFQGYQGFKNKSESVYYYALGEAGMSVHLAKNFTEILLGGPGILQWRGMIIKYSDGGATTGIILQKSGSQHRSFDEVDIPNPFYINKLEDFSYFGYAASSGKFIKGSDEVWYVGGGPRGKNLYGQVLVYEYNQKNSDLKIHFEMSGRQQGEYFGSVIAAGDLNNDGADDIIIGSPMYAEDPQYDVGCIYLFTNNGKGIFTRKIIDGPQISGIRFGSAISVIGDINKDNFSDVAVGAPFYNGGQGAIFIYLGSKNGITADYSQRILGSEISPTLKSFGSSFSRGVDIDGNYYNDLAVGAYKSGHVIVIKTRPVVNIIPSLTSKHSQISIKTKTFTITACIHYTGQHVPQTLNVRISLTADPFYKRVFFTKNRGTAWENSKQYSISSKTCEDLDITVTNLQSDFTQPIVFEMTHELTEGKDNGVFCPTCPIVDKRSTNLTLLTIPYETGCGSDNICQPDLKLQTRFLHDKPYLVIGSTDVISIRSEIKNDGEPAFVSKFYTEIPASTSFAKIPNVCQQLKNNILLCDMGNPIFQNETKTLTIQIDVSALNTKDKLEIRTNVTSAGSDTDMSSNVAILTMPLKTEVAISVLGMSEPEQFIFVDEEKMLKQDNFQFTHQFTLYNLGPSPLDDLELVFTVPRTIGNQDVVKIFEPEITLEDNSLICTVTNKEDFFVDTKDDEPTELDMKDLVTSETRNKRSSEVEELQIPNTSPIYSKMQKIIASDTEIPEDLPLNRTLSLSCVSPKVDVKCMEIKCISGPLTKSKNQVTVNFRLDADLKTLDEIREQKDIIVVTSSVQPLSKHFKVNVTYIHTVLQGSLRPGSALQWIILGCVLGLVILCLIIFGLYKTGFFKRQDHEKLLNEKEQSTELIEASE